MTDVSHDRERGRDAGGGSRHLVRLLLLVPLLLVVLPPLYNRVEPELFGIPFFYWYQLAVIPVSVLCTVVVYRAERTEPGATR